MPRGRPITSKSWDNKIETHPWVRFPEEDNDAKYLILGSFPPNKFTVYRQRLSRCDEEFFYGSKDNIFWDLFILCKKLNYKWPDDVIDLKEWLQQNKWIVCDIILSTYRKKDSATDTDLIIRNYNTDTIQNIFKRNQIEKVYFTSKWVSDKFHKNVSQHIENYLGHIEEFKLISPSPAGLISTQWCRDLFFKNDEENLEDYRKRYYEWVFNK